LNTLDVVVLLLAIGAAIGGYRLGFLARVMSWVGMAIGVFLAAWVLPSILRNLEEAEQASLLLVVVGTLLGGAFLGQALGLLAGSRLHVALPQGQARTADRTAGGIAGVLGVLIGLWLMLPTLADVPGWPAEQARSSLIAGAVDDAFPEAPDTLQALRRLVGEDQFPRVFEGLDRTEEVGPPPAETGISQEVANAVIPSTVKVEGVACRRIQEGSGFVVAPELIVTNAHVVAGEDETVVERSDGSQVRARVVVFDPERDLAVLRTPGLNRPALEIGDTEAGGTGGVFGHPGGGTLRIAPFRVSEEVRAQGRDIYDSDRTLRQVLVLASELMPGDSGGALIDGTGAVVGVAFAIAPDRPGVSYALTAEELRVVLQGNLTEPVDTGPCLV
jgi:S1-C subfamily serine protease